MRFIRPLLISLAIAAVFAVVLVAAAFNPYVQAWLVERVVAKQPGWQASVGEVTAGLSAIRLSEVRLQRAGAVITLPRLDAKLPVKTALWEQKLSFQTLVAKGWTLDLSRSASARVNSARGLSVGTSPPSGPTGIPLPVEGAPLYDALRILRGVLNGWELPYDTSLEGVDLEGDVLLAAASGSEPTRVHVSVNGGGLVAGHTGDFACDVVVPWVMAGGRPGLITIHGQLAAAMRTPRTIERVEFKGVLSTVGGALPDELAFTATAAAADSTGGERYRLELSRAGRPFAALTANFSKESGRISGDWKIDWRDSEIADFFPGRPLPTFTASAEGTYSSDTTFQEFRATGRLNGSVSRLGVLAPGLNSLGAVSLSAGFDLNRAGRSMRVERLEVAVVGDRPVGVARLVQPCDFDEKTGGLSIPDPAADWLEVSLQALPIAWVNGLTAGLTFLGGEVTGDFTGRSVDGRIALRAKAPLVARDVSVANAGRMLGRGLDLSLAFSAENTAEGWSVMGAPLTIDSAGRRLATIEAKVLPQRDGRRGVSLTGTWSADLEALAIDPTITALRMLKGRTASGDFSATSGSALEVTGKINLVGHYPSHTATANVRAYFDAAGGVSFNAPVTVSFGASASDFLVDFTSTNDNARPRLELDLSGVNVALEHLTPLAAGLLAAGDPALPGLLTAVAGGGALPGGLRDERPFWGDWSGRVKFGFYRLQTGGYALHQMGGTIQVERDSIRLEGGKVTIAPVIVPPPPPAVAAPANRPRPAPKAEPPSSVVTMDGTLSFTTAAEFPYRLQAAAAVDTVESARLFTAAQAESDRVVEGRFAVTQSVASDGINLADLVERRREEFRLTGKNGILRLLKANVAEALPDAKAPVTDTLASVGSALGSLLGMRGDSLASGKVRLSKETEAVLNFSYLIPEFRYDQFKMTVVRDPDRTMRFTEIEVDAPNTRLTGSGRIMFVKNLPLRSQSLALDLRLGVKGNLATLLTTAGLVATEKDQLGYLMLPQMLHFGGSLEQIDQSLWRDLLVKAATPKPERAKK